MGRICTDWQSLPSSVLWRLLAPPRNRRLIIVYGVSNNQRSWYDNSNAYRLGYKPEDNSEPYAEAVLAAEAVQPRGCAVAVLPEIRGDYAGGVVPP